MRVPPVAVRAGEGPLIEPTAGGQARRRELVFMPHCGLRQKKAFGEPGWVEQRLVLLIHQHSAEARQSGNGEPAKTLPVAGAAKSRLLMVSQPLLGLHLLR